MSQSLYHTFQRYRTLYTNRITALPIVILMPHSACNCRCVMCDIWKGNKNIKQLTANEIQPLLTSLKKLGTKQVLISGGEALLHKDFFTLCALLKNQGLHITLLSTGLLLKKNADNLLSLIDDIIVSLDGDAATHDAIRNIQGAFAALNEGVQYLKSCKPSFSISARTVIHRLNFKVWPAIIKTAKQMGVDTISFLPADVSSEAFNRKILWTTERQYQIALSKEELPPLQEILDNIVCNFEEDFKHRFIAESPLKLQQIVTYYKAIHGLCAYPFRKCNAPWVSTVIEPDGSVRPCFFHPPTGNIHTDSLHQIVNNDASMQFRQSLDMEQNPICQRCVCSLNLPPRMSPVGTN